MLEFGVDLRPRVPGNRNTRLAVMARGALKGRVAEVRLDDLDKQIEQGGLTLDELEELALVKGAMRCQPRCSSLWHHCHRRGGSEFSGDARTRCRPGSAERIERLGEGARRAIWTPTRSRRNREQSSRHAHSTSADL